MHGCKSFRISIHAPRGRGDGANLRGANLSGAISIHAPRGRGDHHAVQQMISKHISIHAPRGRGDIKRSNGPQHRNAISIHAPRGRGDIAAKSNVRHGKGKHFNPRPSREGRQLISSSWPVVDDFNPRPSREGRRRGCLNSAAPQKFQSTPLAGGATSDKVGACRRKGDFNPRPSREGRHYYYTDNAAKLVISIHAPRGRGDLEMAKFFKQQQISIHAPRGRGDQIQQERAHAMLIFQSTPLAGGAT